MVALARVALGVDSRFVCVYNAGRRSERGGEKMMCELCAMSDIETKAKFAVYAPLDEHGAGWFAVAGKEVAFLCEECKGSARLEDAEVEEL